ncbi:MAG: MATE family efflux transporter [Bacteroidales bacterium]
MAQSVNNKAYYDLGNKKISTLLKQYAWPAIIAMTATSLYNIVDAIFIGQKLGPMAISGLAITFPFMNLGAAVGSLVGVGSASILSIFLGQKNHKGIDAVLGNNLMLNIIIGITYSVIALIFLDPLLTFFGASENTLPYAKEYMSIILIGNVFTHLYWGFNGIIRAAGHPKKAMSASMFSVIINIFFDYLFIIVMDSGIAGAAYATMLSQILSLIYQTILLTNKKELVRFKKGIYHLDRNIIKKIFSIGMSPFLMNAVGCIVVIIINRSLLHYGGDIYIGAYGIINRVAFVTLMINMGLTQGMQPIVGYNYGAENRKRVLDTVHLTMKIATIILTVGWLLYEIIPETLVGFFTNDAELIKISARGMRIELIAFPFIGYAIVASNFFQSIGKAKTAIFLSLTRQLIFLIPFLLILPIFFNTDGVWAANAVSDIISTVVAYIMFIRFRKSYKLEDKTSINNITKDYE